MRWFKQPFNIVIEFMLEERYIMRDAVSHWEPRVFTVRMLRSAKDAGLTETKVQLNIIYNKIDLKLCCDISQPMNRISTNEFLSSLDNRKHEW